MVQMPPDEHPRKDRDLAESHSSVATHRRGERMRTYVPHPRHEARM